MKVRNLFPDIEYPRSSGRTTALCLKYLADAIYTPGREIKIRDHADDRASHAAAYALCRQMVAALGLQHMRFHEDGFGQFYVTFDLFSEKRTTDIIWVHPEVIDSPATAGVFSGGFSDKPEQNYVGMIDIETFLRCRTDDALFAEVQAKLLSAENGHTGT